MNFINPIGRNAGDGIQPQACTCNTTSSFAGARSDNDSCIHCGFACGNSGEYRTGNHLRAYRTMRSSTL
jgi:putative bacteriocin precursor